MSQVLEALNLRVVRYLDHHDVCNQIYIILDGL